MRTFLALVTAALTFAQTDTAKANWKNVNAIGTGEEIRVSLTDGRNLRGMLVGTSEESLAITTVAGQQTIDRAHVNRVFTPGTSHRGRNALIGLSLGAGGGLAIGAAGDSTCKSNCFLGPNVGKEVLTPVGALIGVAIGALWPTGGWREVYRAK